MLDRCYVLSISPYLVTLVCHILECMSSTSSVTETSPDMYRFWVLIAVMDVLDVIVVIMWWMIHGLNNGHRELDMMNVIIVPVLLEIMEVTNPVSISLILSMKMINVHQMNIQ